MGHIICDSGEAALVPTPYYYGLHSSLKVRGNVDVVPIQLTCEPRPGESQPFELTVERAEEAYQKAIQEGIKVKGLFLINPNNPLGDVYGRQQILDLLKFAKSHDLHVVMDEVYMNTIYQDGVEHYSIFQFKEDEIPDLQKVHFIWTFSKDLAMGGMRISMNYTWNDGVRDALLSISHFHSIPTGWQKMMTKLMVDTVSSIAHGGGEIDLNKKLLQAGVEFTPSLTCQGAERGWFRVVYARKKSILETALQRIQRALQS